MSDSVAEPPGSVNVSPPPPPSSNEGSSPPPEKSEPPPSNSSPPPTSSSPPPHSPPPHSPPPSSPPPQSPPPSSPPPSSPPPKSPSPPPPSKSPSPTPSPPPPPPSPKPSPSWSSPPPSTDQSPPPHSPPPSSSSPPPPKPEGTPPPSSPPPSESSPHPLTPPPSSSPPPSEGSPQPYPPPPPFQSPPPGFSPLISSSTPPSSAPELGPTPPGQEAPPLPLIPPTIYQAPQLPDSPPTTGLIPPPSSVPSILSPPSSSTPNQTPSANSNPNSDVQNHQSSWSKLSGAYQAGIIAGSTVGGVLILALLTLLIFYYIHSRKKRRRPIVFAALPPPHGSPPCSLPLQLDGYHYQQPLPMKSITAVHDQPDDHTRGRAPISPSAGLHSPATYRSATPEPGSLGSTKLCFTYKELLEITDGFSNVIGEGGFGCVYQGELSDGRLVAVKELKDGSGQGEREFRAEVDIISRVHHRHLVSLVGYCIAENHRLLVYEFVPNGTLSHHLHDKEMPVMEWSKRLKIAIGAARGLGYLHDDCHPKIIHRDIKSANILLDNSFEAQVADFGLATFKNDANTHISTRVVGTFGYMAPEYASSGKLTDKSDVYSFGVVLLELVTGRKSVDTSQPLGDESLVEWARPLLIRALDTGDFTGIADPRLENKYVEGEMYKMIEAAAACVRHSAPNRPRMVQVVTSLDNQSHSPDLSNGVKFGESTAYESGQYSADIRNFRRMAFGSSRDSSEYDASSGEYSREMQWTNQGSLRPADSSSPEFPSSESEAGMNAHTSEKSRNNGSVSSERPQFSKKRFY